MKINYLYKLLGTIAFMVIQGCSSFLDIKSDKSLTVPSTLEDFQAMLNETDNILSLPESEAMSCDHSIPDARFETLPCQTIKDMYRWMDSPQIESCNSSGWTLAFKNIYRANVVINGLEEYEADKGKTDNSSNLKGQGFFIRGINYFELAQVWMDAYSGPESRSKLGLPLKYSSDFNEPTIRATLGKTIDRIVEDLNKAAELLPERSRSLYLPGKPAAWAYLSRVYLYIQEYELARHFAKKCLEAGYELLDYEKIDGKPTFPFKLDNNKEVIYARFVNNASAPSGLYTSGVDPDLYAMYDQTDYRKSLYFMFSSNRYIFRGEYGGGSGGTFCGPTLAEMYLILAECSYRMGLYKETENYLGVFQSKRMSVNHTYDKEMLLDAIWMERRKELVYRGIRFADVKRLNVLGEGITLKRSIREEEFLLLPNDLRSTLLIPQLVIEKSGIEQNPR